VTTGLNSLGGYELYDLVMLSANEYAVVVHVGLEHLKVLTQNNLEKNVRPVEIKQKKSAMRGATGAFDHMKNPLCISDSVKVIDGPMRQESGTIKHINRSILWLHSDTHLKHSGIFVVKGKSCVLAGSQAQDNTRAAMINATYGDGSVPGSMGAPVVPRPSTGHRGGAKKDVMIGKSVTLTKGSFKGMLAHIVGSTETHYHVELHGRLKKVNVEKGNCVVMGEGAGPSGSSYSSQPAAVESFYGVPSTPALTQQTPQYGHAETPMYSGSETPIYGAGALTPSRVDTPSRSDYDDRGRTDIWRPSALDIAPPVAAAPSTHAWGSGDWGASAPAQNTTPGWGSSTQQGWGGSAPTQSNTGGSTPGWGSSAQQGWGDSSSAQKSAGASTPGWGSSAQQGWGDSSSVQKSAGASTPGWGSSAQQGGWGSSTPSQAGAGAVTPGWGGSTPGNQGWADGGSWKSNDAKEADQTAHWQPGMIAVFRTGERVGSMAVLDSSPQVRIFLLCVRSGVSSFLLVFSGWTVRCNSSG
jgi:transcription elongation factor SPT5